MTDIICPACTLPIPEDEGVTVQFEVGPDEVWHRDCWERELLEFYGGDGEPIPFELTAAGKEVTS